MDVVRCCCCFSVTVSVIFIQGRHDGVGQGGIAGICQVSNYTRLL